MRLLFDFVIGVHYAPELTFGIFDESAYTVEVFFACPPPLTIEDFMERVCIYIEVRFGKALGVAGDNKGGGRFWVSCPLLCFLGLVGYTP